MELDGEGRNYVATLDVSNLMDGSLEIYFYDGSHPTHYDSNLGQNYTFNLRRE
jgi:hypothetical protein